MCHHCPSGFSLIMASSHTQPCAITAHRASPSSWHQAIHNHVSSLPIGLLSHHGIKPYTTMCHHCPSGFSLIMASSHTQPCVITAHRTSPSSWHQAILITAHRASPSPLIMASSHTQSCVITAHRASPSSWHQAIHNIVSSLPIGLLRDYSIKPYAIMCHHCPSGFLLTPSSLTYTLNNGKPGYPFIHHTRPFPIACIMSSCG